MNLDIARRVFDLEAQSLLSLKDKVDHAFSKACEHILQLDKSKGKLIVTGIGKSGLIGKKISSTFSSTGTPSFFLHPAEALHGDLGAISANDLVCAISYGGETSELLPMMGYLARKNFGYLAITGNMQSDLAKNAIAALDVRVLKEACPLGLAPTSSAITTLAMGDALACTVMTARNFRPEDFAQFHPGGGLGFRLSQVRDLMYAGPNLPLLSEEASMRDVISVMSRGDVRGVSGILDASQNLIGVITDGDLRRKLELSLDPLTLRARDLMSHNPRTIDAEESSEKALFLMEQFRINLLFVMTKSKGKPVGVLHIQDLLRAKLR